MARAFDSTSKKLAIPLFALAIRDWLECVHCWIHPCGPAAVKIINADHRHTKSKATSAIAALNHIRTRNKNVTLIIAIT